MIYGELGDGEQIGRKAGEYIKEGLKEGIGEGLKDIRIYSGDSGYSGFDDIAALGLGTLGGSFVEGCGEIRSGLERLAEAIEKMSQ